MLYLDVPYLKKETFRLLSIVVGLNVWPIGVCDKMQSAAAIRHFVKLDFQPKSVCLYIILRFWQLLKAFGSEVETIVWCSLYVSKMLMHSSRVLSWCFSLLRVSLTKRNHIILCWSHCTSFAD